MLAVQSMLHWGDSSKMSQRGMFSAPCNKIDLSTILGKGIKQALQVFKERPSQARSLDDPRLRLSFLNLPVDTFRFDQENMTQKQASIMQKFPYQGKLSLKGNMAEKE